MNNRKLAVLLSGRGSNFVALYEAIRRGDLDASICCVISNVADAAGLARAREFGLTAICLPSQGIERTEYDRMLAKTLRPFAPALVCLAGFMRIVGPEFLREYPSRVLNIHPALLPAFPGTDAQKQALEYGVKFTGCTVHIVDEGVDSGPIVCQAVVPVLDEDTPESLSARILKEEHRIYSEAVCLLVEDKVRIAGRRALRKG